MSEYVLFTEELLHNFYDPATCSYMVPLSGKAAHDMGVLRDENATLKAESAKLRVENARLRKLLDDGLAERGTCRLEGFADVPFSVDYEIEGYDTSSSRDYATLAECSSCGAYVIVPPSYHHVLTCDVDEVYQPYLFCPNCGSRIVEVDA